MSNKGQFKKGNKMASKPKSKKITKSVYNKIETKVFKEKKPTEHTSLDYLKFGDDNLFPQTQVELNRKSPVSRAVINSKKDYIIGKGYQTENEFFNNYKPNKSQTMFDLTSNMGLDRLYTGNEWLEIVRIGQEVFLNHIDSTKCRYSVDRKSIMVHPDWSKYNSYKKLTTVYPLYPNFEAVGDLNGLRCMVHVADYEPTFASYGIPSNIAGNDSAEINYKTNRWNNNRVENSFQTSGLLMLNADFEDEDAANFSEDFDNAFAGHENAGKPLKVINPSNGERNDTKWIPFADTVEGHWIDLHSQSVQELVTANNWFLSLMGQNQSTGFDTERIRNEYQIALNTVILKEQRIYIQLWQRLFKDLFNQDLEDLEILNEPPVNMVDVDNIADDVIALNAEVSEGRMDKEVAKATLKISYNLDNQQLDELFK